MLSINYYFGIAFSLSVLGVNAYNSNPDRIDADYYFGIQRSDACTTHCSIACGFQHMCIDGACFCLKPVTPLILETKDPAKETEVPPVLRHHIAHFCPNLDEARICIKSCMQLGKPAFCGKDHVCYCGHEYSENNSVQKINLADTYGQFHDLYEKYFGPKNKYESSDERN